jgi:hypothetical protein
MSNVAAAVSKSSAASASEFYIEKGVPIPLRRGNGKASRFPFADMKPDDSFFAKGVIAAKLTAAVIGWKKKHGKEKWKFCTRTVEGGSHIWRLE